MTKDVKALKSGIWYTAANFINKSIGLIITPVFTRLLTHEEFGAYNNYTSWLSIITIIVTLNLESTFISARFDFENDFDGYIYSSLSLSSCCVAVCIIVFNIFSDYFVDFFEIDRIYINGMLVYLMFLPAINMYQARERYKYEYKKTVFISLLTVASTSVLSVLLVLLLSNKLMGRIFGSIIPTAIIGFIIYVIIARKGKKINVSYWKYAIAICLPYIPHLLSLTVLNSVDRIMINEICGNEETALYSLAYTAGSLISLLIVSLNTASSPWIGEKLHENKYEEIKSFSKKYISVFMILAFGAMLISPEILMILGGKTYISAMYVMPPVMLGCVCQFLYTMFVNVEQFKKKTLGMACASVSAAILNYILNLIFIPVYGYIAAAYTTLISYLWLLIVHMALVKIIGYGKAYDYFFVIKSILAMLIFSVFINILYGFTLIRYVVIFLYVLFLIAAIFKYKNQIIKLVKNYRNS